MTPLEQFGLACLEESREEFGDLDGGWLQDKAEELGLLVRVEVAAPCSEICHCADIGDFPNACLRYSPEIQKIVEAK
jgi:hypothetical protein